jgi:hypothetical protein
MLASGAVRHSPRNSWINLYGWSRAVQQLKKVPGLELPEAIASQLLHAWGDDSTSISPSFLVKMFHAAANATGTIVEFGAGASTIAMAWACRGRSASVLAIDHDPARRRRVMVALSRLSRRSGDVRLAQLENSDGLAWPMVDLRMVRRPIAFVVCHRLDGLAEPQEAWRRIIQPSLPDDCPVHFDPA